jgi:hypothetical protein
MGSFDPVFSGASMQHMPVPAPGRILVSVAELAKSKAALKRVRKIIKRSGAEKIYMDNGMFTFFQKWQAGKKVTFNRNQWVFPKGVDMNLISEHIAYYNAVIQPYATFCLDLPVPRLPRKHDPGEEEFHFSLKVHHNITRAREMAYLKTKHYPQVNQFFVFQGYNLNQLIFIKTELGNLEFDGYALPTRSLKWNQMVAMMILLYHYGVQRIHILAGSNMQTMAICAFMARHLFDEVSYDSTNWLQFGIFGNLRLFGSMAGIAIGKKIKFLPEQILKIKCGCPHCNGLSVNDYRKMANNDDKRQLSMKHNAFIEVETTKALYTHSETPDMLRDFLLSHSRRRKLIMEMHECLSGIDSMKGNLGDYVFAKGFAEYMFKRF